MAPFRHLVVAAALSVGGLSACSQDPGPDDFVDTLAAARPDMTEEGVRCVVADLRRTYPDETLAELISEPDDGDVDDQAMRAFAARQFDALRACGLEDEVAPDLTASFAAANDVGLDTAECAVGRLRQQYGFWELTDRLIAADDSVRFQRRQFEAIFECGDRRAIADQLRPQLIDQGVDAADADCVAGELAAGMEIADLAVLYSGEMTESFSLLYFGALDSCGALRDS